MNYTSTQIYNITDLQNIITSYKLDLEVTEKSKKNYNKVVSEMNDIIDISTSCEEDFEFDLDDMFHDSLQDTFELYDEINDIRIPWRNISMYGFNWTTGKFTGNLPIYLDVTHPEYKNNCY